jgi:hypothetical protein
VRIVHVLDVTPDVGVGPESDQRASKPDKLVVLLELIEVKLVLSYASGEVLLDSGCRIVFSLLIVFILRPSLGLRSTRRVATNGDRVEVVIPNGFGGDHLFTVDDLPDAFGDGKNLEVSAPAAIVVLVLEDFQVHTCSLGGE